MLTEKRTGTYNVSCPYCKGRLEACHDDYEGWDYGDEYETEICCPECGRKFVLTCSVIILHESRKMEGREDGCEWIEAEYEQ